MSNKYNSWYYKRLLVPVMNFFAAIKWTNVVSWLRGGKPGYDLTPEDWAKIAEALKKDYYVILTRRRTHLTTYLIALASFIKTGKMAYWTHAFMNIEKNVVADATQLSAFRFMEATAPGVHPSKFEDVMDSDAIVLLRPKYYTKEEMTAAVDKMISEDGLPYDDLFDICSDKEVSCIEAVRTALMSLPEYALRMRVFEWMIKSEGNALTPQMAYDCPDFEVELEIRR